MANETRILGLKLNLLSKQETVNKIKAFFAKQKTSHLITLNPEMVVLAKRDSEFKKIVNEAALVLPDGIGVVWAVKLKNRRENRDIERITGADLVYRIAKEFNSKQRYKFFLFGGKKNIVSKATKKLKKLFPDINIVGVEEGYNFNDEQVMKKINHLKTNILLVALGSPRQEKWIARHIKEMPSVRIAIGVGGAFDFISGRVKRVPLFLQNMGLEWFWRLLRQPWRIRRIFRAVIIFPFLVLKGEILKTTH